MARQARHGPYNYERLLGQRNYQVSSVVDEWVQESKVRLRYVVRESVQAVFIRASKAMANGGRMRVDTGFLRASGSISLIGMPSGPGRGERKEPNSYPFDQELATASLKGFELGHSIYVGWTANYAKYREAYDAFLHTQLQNWQSIVDEMIAKARKRSDAARARRGGQ